MGSDLKLDAPLSFWGGLDPETGRIIDPHHPQFGECIAARRLIMPGTRGSTSSAGVLAAAFRNGTGPAEVVLPRPDLTVMSAVAVVRLLYGTEVAVTIDDHD